MTPRRAFTLVELMVVVVIIGLLASIAVARFGEVKERAYVASMQADLRAALSAQFAYAETQLPPTYAQSIGELGSNFRPSAGVSITFASVTAQGFGAVATHSGTAVRCALFQGPAVTAPATVEGKIACE